MKKILIIGGAGFIGKAIPQALCTSGFDVSAADLHCLSENDCNVTCYKGSYLDEQWLESIIQNRFDTVIHLASTTTPSTSNLDVYVDLQENLLPTVILLKLCVKYGVKQFIFASSGGAIYGNPETLPANEHLRSKPLSSYGIVKNAIEQYMSIYQKNHDISCISLRMANPYGPGQSAKVGFGVIPTFITKVLNGEKIKILGDGTNERDYIYIDDVSSAFINAVHSNVNGNINIGSGVGVSLMALVNTISLATSREVIVEFDESRSSDVYKIYLDISKAISQLNWKPETDLNKGIMKTVNWISMLAAGESNGV